MIREIFNIEDCNEKTRIVSAYIFSLIFLCFIALIGNYSIPIHIKDFETLFDAQFYYNIGLNGYSGGKDLAFFPLFPLVIRFFNIFKIPVIGTLIFNNILKFLTGIIMYNLAKKVYNRKENTAFIIVLLFYLSPISIFTSVLYTESLFIFLSILTFYLYKIRDNPILAGVSLGLTVCTKSTGAILFIVIFIFLFINLIKNKNKIQLIFITKMYIPATILSLLYPLYLQIKFGNWRAFIDIQYTHWSKIKGNIFDILNTDLNLIGNTEYFTVKCTIAFAFVGLLVAFILILQSLKFEGVKSLDMIILLMFSILLIFQSYTQTPINAAMTSYFRYIYATFPMYLLINDKSKNLAIILISISVVMNYITTTYYLWDIFLA